ncbi:protein kinase [Streptomyces sp. V4I2]|uniref:protein kinase domain-containing protein n=1 Tax=Streptomyces sp. V4I2 TaxID=3042280 RepID=UPI00277F6497|nr:protein kinase [Streptomyces sp. V4I2]MDQ1050351.1 serine/threonine protein kinase [Streptomyces sp. V4I2]
MAERLLDGRYLLADRIGAGGMGEVWRAHDERLRREVAVKRITQLGQVQDPKAVARFVQEAQVVARLSSRHIVTVHDIGTAALDGGPELPYLVMELLHGRPLDRLIQGAGRLPRLDDACRWGSQMSKALVAAHAAGVVHRDMKPANVLVTRGEAGEDDSQVKVLDFGIARFLDGTGAPTALTATGTSLGTPAYMSPEQIRADPDRPVDERSDLYSLGCILYELVTGRLPFEAPSVYPLLRKHIDEPPTPPRRLRAELPTGWDALILALLAKSPDDRPQTARDVRERLEELGGEGSATPPPAPPPRRSPRADAPHEADARTRVTPPSPRPAASHPPTRLDRGTAASRPPIPSDPGSAAPHRPAWRGWADARPPQPNRRERAVSRTPAPAPPPRPRSRRDEPLTVGAIMMVVTVLLLPWWAALILTVGSATFVHVRNRRRSNRHLYRDR